MDEHKITYDFADVSLPKKYKRRRNLLPWWIIGCIWIFLLTFAVMPIAIVLGVLKFDFELSLLGLTTHEPVSLIGLIVVLIFLLKGITAFALWTEKRWAVSLAKIDAIISIVICCCVMAYGMFTGMFTLRLELAALFPYYYKMSKIQYDWEYFDDEDFVSSEIAG